MIKEIMTNRANPNAVLYQRCLELDFDNKKPGIPFRTTIGNTIGEQDAREAAEIITDLLDTAEKHRKFCLGLSANQIGHPYRIFVMRRPGGKFLPVVNPVLIGTSGGAKALHERCLSRVDKDGKYLPGIRMRRPKRIIVEFWDVLAQKRIRQTFRQMEARVFLHELDHLNGKDI